MRIGIGYDVHKLVYNRPLIIGGVNIPYEKGLDGHSDADVLIHAIIDAILGAMNLGDIGKLFPDNDEKYKNISSLKLLSKVDELIRKNNYVIENIDSIIVAQSPKMQNFIQEMKINISKVLNIEETQISIKATTTETLGFEGRSEGISSHAVIIIKN